MKYSKLLIITTLLLFSLNTKANNINNDTCIGTDILSLSLVEKECPVAITTIPSLLMKKQWFLAQDLMNHWFEGTGDDYFLELSDLTKINSDLDDTINELSLKAKNNTLLTEGMKKELIKELKATNPNFISGGSGTFDHIGTEFSLLGNSWLTVEEESEELHYIASPSVGKYGLDKYGAAIGRSNLRMVASGSYENNTIHVARIGLYLRDSYDFSTIPQALGYWSKTSPYVKIISSDSNYRPILNASFRNWGRFYHNNPSYGDFRIFTNMVEIETHQVFNFQPVPYFDGTGSLVDPQSGCDSSGCSDDYVMLHPHGHQASAGFFQVFKIPNSCEAVRLDNLGEASVEIRSWAGRGKDSKYYKVNNTSNIIPLSATWNLIAFKTDNPIDSSVSVQATCLSNSSSVNAIEFSGTPFSFENNYYWGGNGSLINHSNNQYNRDAREGYGRTQDTVAIFEDKKALSVFQVTNTNSCRKIKFETPVSFNLSWKLWDDEEWQGNKTVRNNDVFTLPSGYWWILKVKAPPATDIATNKLRINAICQE